MTYLDATADFYREAINIPNVGLCYTISLIWALLELVMPKRMLEMNFS